MRAARGARLFFLIQPIRSLFSGVVIAITRLASFTGTATTTLQMKNLIGRVRKNKRAARAARTYEQVRTVLCKTTAFNYHIYHFDDTLSIQP